MRRADADVATLLGAEPRVARESASRLLGQLCSGSGGLVSTDRRTTVDGIQLAIIVSRCLELREVFLRERKQVIVQVFIHGRAAGRSTG